MSARVIQYVTSGTTTLEVAHQDYELAKNEVEGMLWRGFHRMPKHRERYMAAVHRRAEARTRWLKAMGA